MRSLVVVKKFLVQQKAKSRFNRSVLRLAGYKAIFPQCSFLGPLLFFFYINDLAEGLKSSIKLSVNNTSIFFIVKNPTKSLNELNSNLKIIDKWAFQGSFNTDPLKQASDVCFSTKSNVTDDQDLVFNKSTFIWHLCKSILD